VFRIVGNTFYDRKNKIPMKIPESKRSETGIIAEFHGILNGFSNLAARGYLLVKYSTPPTENLLKTIALIAVRRSKPKR
jgi:hypothetical protein